MISILKAYHSTSNDEMKKSFGADKPVNLFERYFVITLMVFTGHLLGGFRHDQKNTKDSLIQ